MNTDGAYLGDRAGSPLLASRAERGHTGPLAPPQHLKKDSMRHTTTVLSFAVTLAFVAGVALSPLAQHALPNAHAQAVPLAPAMIDLAALKHGDIPTTPNPEMNARGLVITDNATIGIQS